MARSLEEIRAENPPADQDAYDQAYAEATLAFDLAQMAYRLRTEAKLSQRELAARMGTTQSAIARLESGGVLPRLSLLAKLGRATGVRIKLTDPTGSVEVSKPTRAGRARRGRALQDA